MTPKEFQKSHLAVELKAGRKRLEDALHGLSDEQCERAGPTRSGSVVDLLSEIVAREFLALMELSDRLPSLLMNLLANTDGRTPTVSGAEKDAMTLTSKIFSFAKIFHGVYAATRVSWAVTGVSWATVERNALRIATMILRPPEVSW
jgi:hypothetical protein